MLPTNLIQLDNPPSIKFYAFYKVCHKKLKKLYNIKKVFSKVDILYSNSQHDRVRTTNKKSHTQNSFKIHF